MTQRLVPGVGYMTFGRNAETLLPGYGHVTDNTSGPTMATAITLAGPSEGMSGYASFEFTATVNGALQNPITVTPSDGGLGGTFTPSSFILTTEMPGGSFTYTPSIMGDKTITLSNTSGGSIANPPGHYFYATKQIFPPSVSISDVVVDGNDVLLEFVFENEPTSGVASLTPTDGDGVTYGPTPIEINGETGTLQFEDLVPGTYSAAVSVSNTMGVANSAPVEPINIGEISGEITPNPPKLAVIRLTDAQGNPVQSRTNLKWAWFDQSTPDEFMAPTDFGAQGATNANGDFVVLVNNSNKVSGQTGWLIVTDSDGDAGSRHSAFSGPVNIQ